MRGIRIATLGALGLLMVACTTITEELPTRPDPSGVGGGRQPLPVVVVPVPVPTPANNTPAPNPTASPTNPANTNPNPNPPPPPPDGGIPPDIPNNTAPVTKLGAKVYFVECNGVPVPNSEGGNEAPVGCRVHLDVTPKDASNKPTQTRQTPEWSFSDMSIINLTSSTTGFNPSFIAKAAGTVSAHCEADGVRSNDVTVRLHN
jgi:hypothetical protein